MGASESNLNTIVDIAEQSNEWLTDAAQRISSEAAERGIDLAETGGLAVAGAMQSAKSEAPNHALTTGDAIVKQFSFAQQGYKAVVDSINDGRASASQLTIPTLDVFEEEMEDWLTDDKVEYAAQSHEGAYTLVATPNVIVSGKDIKKVVKSLAGSMAINYDVGFRMASKFTKEQLSGTKPDSGNSIQFSLIPNGPTSGMHGTVHEQREKLAELQALHPDLGLKVPSPFEAVNYWMAMRAKHLGKSNEERYYEQTLIRHFDLPETRALGHRKSVLMSCAADCAVRYEAIEFSEAGRVAVG